MGLLLAYVMFAGVIPERLPALPSARTLSIAEITSRPQSDGPMTVRATLTINGSPTYIQDSTGAAEVEGLGAQEFRIGDEVLVTGDPQETAAGLLLRNGRAKLLWHGSPLPPFSVTAGEAALGKFADLLIEVDGQLLDSGRHDGETWLKLRSGQQDFLALLHDSSGGSLLPKLQKGSAIQLRGVCSLEPSNTRYQGGFAVLLRSAEDVAVVSGPPWWSPEHLVELGLLLAALVGAAHLTAVQFVKTRFRAIIAERGRMAHELHDTLAQGFAGLSYQIQAARKIAPKSNERLSRHLDLALDMVRHSHSEAHRSIMMLRPQSLSEGADLHAAIQQFLEQSTAGCGCEVLFSTTGPIAHLSLMATDAMFRVAQEGIANALRHGHPTFLEVHLQYTASTVRLSICDNGCGFDPRASANRGFGLAGMRERMRALRGHFKIETEPNAGTTVCAELVLRPSPWAHFLSAARHWRG